MPRGHRSGHPIPPSPRARTAAPSRTWSAKLKFMRPADRRTTVRGITMRAVATHRATSRPAAGGAGRRQGLRHSWAGSAPACQVHAAGRGMRRGPFGGPISARTRGRLIVLHGGALDRHQRIDRHALRVLHQRGQLRGEPGERREGGREAQRGRRGRRQQQRVRPGQRGAAPPCGPLSPLCLPPHSTRAHAHAPAAPACPPRTWCSSPTRS